MSDIALTYLAEAILMGGEDRGGRRGKWQLYVIEGLGR